MPSRSFLLRFCFSACWALSLLAGVSLAQGPRGSIGGTITAATGSVLAGTKVTVTNEATGSAFQALSGADGAYLAPQLLPGSYRLLAELQGFKRLTVERVQVNIDQAVTLDLRLEVGELTESVTVEGATVLLNTQSGSVGHG